MSDFDRDYFESAWDTADIDWKSKYKAQLAEITDGTLQSFPEGSRLLPAAFNKVGSKALCTVLAIPAGGLVELIGHVELTDDLQSRVALLLATVEVVETVYDNEVGRYFVENDRWHDGNRTLAKVLATDDPIERATLPEIAYRSVENFLEGH